MLEDEIVLALNSHRTVGTIACLQVAQHIYDAILAH
jgi:hypothetical protein